MEGHDAHCNKADYQRDREILHFAVTELGTQLNHCDLPGETTEPNEGEDDADAVHLVMYELVILIDLKNERIVDVGAPKYLDGKARAENYEHDDRCEVIGVHARVYLFPFRITIVWAHAKEDEKG